MLTAEGSQSVPGGAGDEEANVVQRPPGAGLWPGPSRALRRRRLGLGLRLGLRRVRGALATAQLSAHVLAPPEPQIRTVPARVSTPRSPAQRRLEAPASQGTGVLTSRRTGHAP